MTDTIERRLRDATTSLAASTTTSPDAWDRIVAAQHRRRGPRRTLLAAAAVIVALAVGLGVFAGAGGFDTGTDPVVVSGRPSLPTLPTGATSAAGWASLPKAAAGIEAGASLDAIASNGRVALVAGARASDPWTTAVWRSTDGVHWNATDFPGTNGSVSAIAMHGDEALAVSGDPTGVSIATWRSRDGGRTWTSIATSDELFGRPSDQGGRPFVTGLVYRDGQWIASGGGSAGYTGIWTSADGVEWRQTLDSGAGSSGTVMVVDGGRDRLLAYVSGAVRWSTDDPASWTVQSISKPARYFLSSVAPGAGAALGELWSRHGRPTPLFRSRDGGRTWRVDHSFLEQFPGAWGWTITRTDGLWVVAGATVAPTHPNAWVSRDLESWTSMPEELFGTPGGTLSLVARIGRTVVLFGSAPELDRFYAFDARAIGA